MHKPALPKPPLSPAAQAQTFGRLKKRAEVKREPRQEATLRASMKALGVNISVQILNTSRSGLALRILDRVPSLVGEEVTVTSPDVGVLYGTVRWQRASQIGIEFDSATRTKGRIASYFGFFRKRKIF